MQYYNYYLFNSKILLFNFLILIITIYLLYEFTIVLYTSFVRWVYTDYGISSVGSFNFSCLFCENISTLCNNAIFNEYNFYFTYLADQCVKSIRHTYITEFHASFTDFIISNGYKYIKLHKG